MIDVCVLRAFLLGGARQEPGSALTLPDALAQELVSTGKAALAQPAPAPAGPMTAEGTAELVPGKAAKKGAKHAVD